MLPAYVDVLIVGAGPTGLALANKLQKHGVDHVLIDALEAGQNQSRAAVIHAHTLEMLADTGLAAPLMAEGRPVSRFTIRDRDRALLGIDFAGLPSLFRNLLMIPQSTTEAIFAGRHAASGGSIRRGVSAVSARAGGRGAIVRVKSAGGEQEIEARYAVGADGMHSRIREAAGIPFDGAHDAHSMVLADVRMDWPLGVEEVSFLFAPAGMVVVAPLPDGAFRIVAELDGAPEEPGLADIQQLLDMRGPRSGSCRVHEVIWGSRFRVSHRLAAAYRKGPFLLMGDAAHVHSPAGGQGMNTGLVDAILLGEALVRVVQGGEPHALLDGYAAARRPAAAKVLSLAGMLTRVATLRSAPGRALRNLILRVLNHVPAFKRRLAMNLSGLSRRNFARLPGPTVAIGAAGRARGTERRLAA
ncbi:MAG TPA: FAD-dependent monooxygenase [Allosphingosinicella sp.]|nr:FAD-dependent monooxygenase [Allosphingosinicella sp.]